VNTSDTFAHNGFKRVVVTANDSTQYNWAKGSVQGQAEPSLFTEHFVQGLLSGAADADHDGKITIDDVFAYVKQQLTETFSDKPSQVPRKWVPYAYQDASDLVIACNPNYEIVQVIDQEKASSIARARIIDQQEAPEERPLLPPFSRLVQRPALWLAGLAMLATVIIVLLAGQPWRVGAENLADVTDTTAAASSTKTVFATANLADALTGTAVSRQASISGSKTPTSEHSQEPTATVSPTTTSSPTTIVEPTAAIVTERAASDRPMATALLSSSLYVSPDSDAQEVTFITVGEYVTVLGRSEVGEWFYVQNEAGEAGFVFGPRLDWSGDFEALTIVTGTAVANPTTNAPSNICNGSTCPPLTLTLYPLPGTRCEASMKYRTVYMEGDGGNGRYTYYWNGQKVGGPTNEGFGFEVSSPDGSAVIGTGKVVSGDGQVVEKELFVSDFNCN
jgi:hypothetical protein